jgi:hypothetical protein
MRERHTCYASQAIWLRCCLGVSQIGDGDTERVFESRIYSETFSRLQALKSQFCEFWTYLEIVPSVESRTGTHNA